jgi:hypothetical protein
MGLAEVPTDVILAAKSGIIETNRRLCLFHSDYCQFRQRDRKKRGINLCEGCVSIDSCRHLQKVLAVFVSDGSWTKRDLEMGA